MTFFKLADEIPWNPALIRIKVPIPHCPTTGTESDIGVATAFINGTYQMGSPRPIRNCVCNGSIIDACRSKHDQWLCGEIFPLLKSEYKRQYILLLTPSPWISWWHGTESLSVWLALCQRIHRLPVDKGPITQSFDVFIVAEPTRC